MTAGELQLDGQPLRVRSPADAIAAGCCSCPKIAACTGWSCPKGVGFNLSLPNLDRLGSPFGVSPTAEAELHRTWIDRLRVKTPSAAQPVGLLSGGNQQKVVYGKWLARDPTCLDPRRADSRRGRRREGGDLRARSTNWPAAASRSG